MEIVNQHMFQAIEIRSVFQKILCCNLKKLIYLTYGYHPQDDFSDSQIDFLDGKLKEAEKDFMDWFCKLDPENATRMMAILDPINQVSIS